MADYRVVDKEKLDNNLTAIADGIREKAKTEGELTFPEGFVSAINEIDTKKEEQEKTLSVTANGSYSVEPDEGKALSKVDVDVNVSFEGDVGKPYIDTSKIKSYSNWYVRYPELIDEIDTIDTSNSTNFEYMLKGCSVLTTIPQLDTSKGTNFYGMFSGCSNLQTIPKLDTSNGTDFSFMFNICDKLLSIPQLDIRNGTKFACMFQSCARLTTVSLTTPKGDLSTNTFSDCSNLSNLTIGEGWAFSIYLHYSNNLTVESLHGMIENLADLTGKTAKTFKIGSTNLAKIDAEHLAMLQNKNWNYS